MRLLILPLTAALVATAADAEPGKIANGPAWGCKVDREPAWAVRPVTKGDPAPGPRSDVKGPEVYRLKQPSY